MIGKGPGGSLGSWGRRINANTADSAFRVTQRGNGIAFDILVGATTYLAVSNAGVVSIPVTTGNSLVVDTNVLVVDASNNRIGINVTAPTSALDVIGGGSAGPAVAMGLRLASNATDATRKIGMIAAGHYTNSEEPIIFGYIDSGVSLTEMYFGGSVSAFNAVTAIIFYTAADNVTVAGTEKMRITSGGILLVGDTANANMTQGLTLNQGASDNQLLAGKSSDVAHGLTSAGNAAAETDDYFSVQKLSATLGGLLLASFAEDPAGVQVAMAIDAFGGQAATAPSTTNENLFIVRAAEHDGANALVNAPANSQIFGIQRRVAGAWNNAFIVDAEGDLFVDGSTTITAFDAWDDVKLVRAFDQIRTDGIIRSRWDDFVKYGRGDLVRAGILSNPHDGGKAMVNITQLQRLHNGAIWQLGQLSMAYEERLEHLEEQNKALCQKLAMLKEG